MTHRCRQCDTVGSFRVVNDHVSCAECGAVVGEIEWYPNVPEVDT